MVDHPVLFGFSGENHKIVAFDGASFTAIPALEGVNGAHTSAPDPSRYIFFDGIHPTTYAAEIISDYYLSVLTAPAGVAVLAEIPLNLDQSYMEAIDAHLQSVQSGIQKGSVIPFLSGGCGFTRIETANNMAGYDQDRFGMAAGLSWAVSDHWILGVAVGHQTAEIEIDVPVVDVDMVAREISILTGYRLHRLFFVAMASVADLTYSDIDRKVQLGPLPRIERGETEGNYKALKGAVSIDLYRKNGFTLGSATSLTYRNITVSGYEENGEYSTAMAFDEQYRRSLSAKTGVYIAQIRETVWGSLRGKFRIHYEKEMLDTLRRVRSGVNTLPGSRFEWPVSSPESASWPFDVSVGIQSATGWEGSLVYRSVLGDGIRRDQGVHLSIGFDF